jgi:glycosyltransferase involved in cell wall biosynthesis
MKIVLLTPGTGSYYCGVCMRDNALAREVIRQGHEALMVPMYLPLTLDEVPVTDHVPLFYGGINVYLQQKFAFFRHTPRWLDRLLNYRGFLRLAGKASGMTGGRELGELTHSMLLGADGKQAKELDELVLWLKNEARPDAVWLSTALLAGLARRITNELEIPVLCSLQGEDSFLDSLPEPWRARSWKTLAECYRDIAAFIAPSRFYADYMTARLHLPPDRLRVIPNGISLEGYDTEPAPEQPPVIGFLARLCREKGLDLVVDAFLELRRRGRHPGARLRCLGAMTAGDARYVERLRTRLAVAGCGEAVEFHPNVSREEKLALLRTITLLSVPTVYGEAFGLFLIEAMAAGVPVVQPRKAAFTEVVEETGGGMLYESDTAEGLAEAWEGLLSDPARARELGRRGRAAVRQEYSIQRLAEHFLELTKEKREEAHSGFGMASRMHEG